MQDPLNCEQGMVVVIGQEGMCRGCSLMGALGLDILGAWVVVLRHIHLRFTH